MGMLAALAALVGIAGAPFAPARNALVPRIVPPEELLRANSLLQVSFRATYFVGPLLLGPLVAASSLAGVFAVDAATFAVSAGTLAALRLGPAARPNDQLGLWSDLVAGWRVLRRAPDVLIVIGTFVLAVLFASGFLTVGVAALVGTSLHGDAGTYGLLLGIAGTFEVIGALLLLRVRLGNLARIAVLAWALLGLFRFPLGLAGSVHVAGALLAMTGIASALTDIPLISHVQARVPDRHLAKALGIWEAGITGAVAIAPPIAAFLIARVGLATGFALSGAALIALGLAAALLLARVDAA
jgi:MFS family permease